MELMAPKGISLRSYRAVRQELSRPVSEGETVGHLAIGRDQPAQTVAVKGAGQPAEAPTLCPHDEPFGDVGSQVVPQRCAACKIGSVNLRETACRVPSLSDW